MLKATLITIVLMASVTVAVPQPSVPLAPNTRGQRETCRRCPQPAGSLVANKAGIFTGL